MTSRGLRKVCAPPKALLKKAFHTISTSVSLGDTLVTTYDEVEEEGGKGGDGRKVRKGARGREEKRRS